MTSPEVRAATTLKARSDLGRLLFLLLGQEKDERRLCSKGGYVVVNFFISVNFIFPLFLCMIMNANEFETKEI